jgi:hypothetical protein
MNTQKLPRLSFDSSLAAPSRMRAPSGSLPRLVIDQREGGGQPAEDAKVTTNVRRPTESHWEWIIDRATD